jgi:hypothetical protein
VITVNVWDPDDENVGHSSLEIDATSSVLGRSTMVSWWPRPTDSFGLLVGTPAEPLSYDEEVRLEGHPPHHRYQLHGLGDHAHGVPGARAGVGLDETQMRNWWILWQQNPSYRLFDRNCCTTAITCLVAGGCRPYAERGGAEIDLTRWAPGPADVSRLCEAIIAGMAATTP